MVSDPPPQRPDEELCVLDDADFGVMRLIRRWSAGMGANETVWREFDLLSWEAKRGDVQLSINADVPEDAPKLTAASRSTILRYLNNEAATRRVVAEKIIDVAREWMFQPGDGPEPTIDSFAAGIKMETISVDRDQTINLWLEEVERDPSRSVFHGHGLLARLDERGAIDEVDLV